MHELYDINISGSNVESALGYNQSNADDLLRQIYEKLPSSEAGRTSIYGNGKYYDGCCKKWRQPSGIT